jgi:hypothetical protein
MYIELTQKAHSQELLQKSIRKTKFLDIHNNNFIHGRPFSINKYTLYTLCKRFKVYISVTKSSNHFRFHYIFVLSTATGQYDTRYLYYALEFDIEFLYSMISAIDDIEITVSIE